MQHKDMTYSQKDIYDNFHRNCMELKKICSQMHNLFNGIDSKKIGRFVQLINDGIYDICSDIEKIDPVEKREKILDGLKNLIGKKVQSIILGEEKNWINFITEDATYVYYCYAGCCSYSWIESIEDIENLIGHTILKYEDKVLTEIYDKDQYHECIRVYSYDIYTEKGVCTIDFRNGSNGYYGGSLELKEIKYYLTSGTRSIK